MLDDDGLARIDDSVCLGFCSNLGDVLDLDTSEVGGRATCGLEGKRIGGELVENTMGLVEDLDRKIASVLDCGRQLEVVDTINTGGSCIVNSNRCSVYGAWRSAPETPTERAGPAATETAKVARVIRAVCTDLENMSKMFYGTGITPSVCSSFRRCVILYCSPHASTYRHTDSKNYI